MSFGESGRVIVVTGADGGIGRAVVDRFTSGGDVVVGLDRSLGHDLRDPSLCSSLVDDIVQEHGRLDVLCNAAGIMRAGDVLSLTAEDWADLFAVNVFATAWMSRAAISHMRGARRGVIINIASVAGVVGYPQRVGYAATKGAVLAMTRAIAADEAAHGIRVCAVSPGSVEGPMNDALFAESADPAAARRTAESRSALGRMATADEVASAVVYLAADDTFVTGSMLLLDGGMTTLRTESRVERETPKKENYGDD